MPTFMHGRVRNFRVGRFEFVDKLLKLEDEDDAEEFRRLMETFSPYYRNPIVELPEQSEQPKEVKSGGKTVRGATSSEDNKDEKSEKSPEKTNEGGGSKAVRGGFSSNAEPGSKKSG